MAQIIGFKHQVYDFVGRDGTPVHSEGMTLYWTYDGKDVVGTACDSGYISYAKLGTYTPAVGDEVNVVRNRWDKIQAVLPL